MGNTCTKVLPDHPVAKTVQTVLGKADKANVLDVFLGGTCGTTTWRNQVIPVLNTGQITCYNPQVAPNQWHEGLMAEELLAKQTCRILLFVIGRETRAVASIAEAAFYIGQGRHVVLVLQPYPETMETLDESADLNRGRRYLRQIAEELHEKVPIYDTPMDAINHIVKTVRQ